MGQKSSKRGIDCCFFLFPVQCISVAVLLASAGAKGMQVRRDLGAHTSLTMFFSVLFLM